MCRFVLVDGGRKHNPKKPTSLNFLENLEIIEGRRLYSEKFSLYIIGNFDLKWLGFRSLKKIKKGMVLITGNKNLCYSNPIPFDKFLDTKNTIWRLNKNESECGWLIDHLFSLYFPLFQSIQIFYRKLGSWLRSYLRLFQIFLLYNIVKVN